MTIIHVPDDKYSLPARIVFQYLLTSQGYMYELKVCSHTVFQTDRFWFSFKILVSFAIICFISVACWMGVWSLASFPQYKVKITA